VGLGVFRKGTERRRTMPLLCQTQAVIARYPCIPRSVMQEREMTMLAAESFVHGTIGTDIALDL
jgi:hypothetical protein